MTDEQSYSHERELGRRIARLREAAGLTQRELARRMGLTQSALSRIESGQRRLSAAQASQLARLLAVDPGTLLDLESPPEPGPGEPAGSAPGAEFPSPEASWDEPVRSQSHMLAVQSETGHLAALAAPPPASRTANRPRAEGLARRVAADAVARGRSRPRALEPPLFAAVVRDALEVEALAGSDAEPHPPGFTRPSPFAALPHAMHGDPVRLARFWRHELGVGDEGPLPDLVLLVEAAGVDVVHARLDSDTPHGACALVAAPWSGAPGRVAQPAGAAADGAAADGATAAAVRPFVFVNGFQRPVALQRFALAHEFAHLALGHGEAYDERLDWSGRSRRETDANAFAEEFVAPLSAVRRWFEMDGEAAGSRAVARDPAASPASAASPAEPAAHSAATSAQLDLIVRLANHFGVSFWVARYRAKAAGILPGPTHVRALDQQLRARGARMIPRQLFLGGLRDTLSVLTAESRPGQSQNPWRIAPDGVRVPGRMRAQVLALLEAGAVPLEQAAAWLRIAPAELRAQLEQFGVE